jgi:hypothetical protein
MSRSMLSSVMQTARPTLTKSRFFRFRNQSRKVAFFTPSRSAALSNRTNLRIRFSLIPNGV